MLLHTLIAVTAVIIVSAMWYAYRATRDPLHPIMFLGPLCFYSYVYKPIALMYLGALDAYFDNRDLIYVQLINVIGITVFCVGSIWHAHREALVRRSLLETRRQLERMLTPGVRQRSLEVAYVLGGLALAAFWFLTLYVGGIAVAYGQVKGGAAATSGYLSEAPMLSLPAIGLLFFAWTGQRIGPGRIALLLILASPLIIHGLLGARRGPTFMILAALMIGGYAVSHRRPKLSTVLVTVFLVGSLLLFLVNNRHRIFLGSEALQQWTSTDEQGPDQIVDTGEDWMFSSGVILTSRQFDSHFWGRRFLVNLFVRPIPRQLWPDKYVATGFGWLDDQSEMHGMSDNEWIAAVGWAPVRGAAAGFIADFYLEFWYFGFIGCFLLGWFYSYLWQRMVVRGGIWAILYLYASILSIYIPTQNVTEAWSYRLLMFSVPTILVWRLYIAPDASNVATVNPSGPAPSRA